MWPGGSRLVIVPDNRGTLIAWSAGVSAVAATFVGVLASRATTPLPQNPWFIACLVVACLSFAILLLAGFAVLVSWWRSRKPRPGGMAAQPIPPAAAITDRWRHAINGLSTALTQLQYNGMSHPAYLRRDPLKRPPPSLRVGIVIASSELDPETPETIEVRARFLNFLGQPEVMNFISELTDVGRASWRARNENPRFNFGAILTSGDEDATPIAWARLLLPESWAPRYGHDARRASLVLHVELSGANGASAKAANLLTWQQRFAQALKLPTALATFLVDDLGLDASGDPPTEAGLWLEASAVLTELVDIDGLTVVPGSPQLSDFTGYAVAVADGLDGERLALAWLRMMSDSCLHIDGSAAALAPLARTGGPRFKWRS
jgi:hypothetical protein